jgi:hypothetical protein
LLLKLLGLRCHGAPHERLTEEAKHIRTTKLSKERAHANPQNKHRQRGARRIGSCLREAAMAAFAKSWRRE